MRIKQLIIHSNLSEIWKTKFSHPVYKEGKETVWENSAKHTACLGPRGLRLHNRFSVSFRKNVIDCLILRLFFSCLVFLEARKM